MDGDAYIVKEVDPEGNIINENDDGNDYLGTTVYAEALARRILSVPTPLTIGIFARWGSGKSFLLKHVQSYLNKFEKQSITGEKKAEKLESKPSKQKSKTSALCWILPCLFIFFLILLVIFAFVLVMSPELFYQTSAAGKLAEAKEAEAVTTKVADVTTTTTTPTSQSATTANPADSVRRRLRIGGIVVVACILLFALLMVTWCGSAGSMFASRVNSVRDVINLLLFAAFTKLPVDEPPSSGEINSHVADQDIKADQALSMNFGAGEIAPNSINRRFIFVNFKAWEYVGSDTLWAGIITNLSDVIEAHFGVVLCRLFRTITLQTCPRDPKEQEVKRGFWETLFVDLSAHQDEVRTEDLVECMKEFGVVHGCHRYKDWRKPNKTDTNTTDNKSTDGWFVVEYTQASYAVKACQNLSLRGIRAYLKDPHAPKKVPRRRRAGGRANNRSENIPMTDIDNGGRDTLLSRRRSEKQPDVPAEGKDKDPRGFCAHHRRHAKTTCWIPIMYWWILLVITAIFVPVLTYVTALLFDLKIFKYPRSVPISIQIFAWLPGAASASFVLIRFVYAMFNSQRSRVQQAMEGSRGNMKEKLGFMDKVKTEVRTITRLIRLIEYVHRREYKVVISIDDLDRVPLDKIKSILDAVSILLSDSNSPFICLVAVDSRIAVKCIEGEMGQTLLKANVNGHEYMRKIINLPFCIPEIDDEHKKSFIDGLMDQSDRTTRIRMARAHSIGATDHPHLRDIGRSAPVVHALPRTQSHQAATNAITDEDDVTDAIVEVKKAESSSGGGGMPSPNFMDKKFLYECRRFFYQSKTVHKHLHGVPRNIKRIFNIISITTLMINCYYKQKKKQDFFRTLTEKSNKSRLSRIPAGEVLMESHLDHENAHDEDEEVYKVDEKNKLFAENLVCWIILTDQWPYRISFILQIIEDADQRYLAGKKDQEISEDISLLEIYQKHVIPLLHKFKAGHEEASLMSLDGDPDIFFSFLKEMEKDGNRLRKSNVKLLMKFTVNLDQSLRQNIAYLRSVSDVDSCVDIIETKTDQEDKTGGDESNKKSPKRSDSHELMHPYVYGPGFYSSGVMNGAFPPMMPYHMPPQASIDRQPSMKQQASTSIAPPVPVTATDGPKPLESQDSTVAAQKCDSVDQGGGGDC